MSETCSSKGCTECATHHLVIEAPRHGTTVRRPYCQRHANAEVHHAIPAVQLGIIVTLQVVA